VIVRYTSAKNTNGAWAAYTAIPSGPVAPTDGHRFTDPSVNFGGEHFGMGYRGSPTNITYHWLVDNGAGWQDRFIDWFRDLGFLQKPGVETKAARDIAAFVNQPQRGGERRGASGQNAK
jgi:hypothetical protein